MISDISISGLKVLKRKYIQDLKYFRQVNSLYEQENAQEYKEMQQRIKMIGEEIDHRMMDMTASKTYQDKNDWFDVETGLVMGMNGEVKYYIAYDDEDGYIYNKDKEETEEEKTDYAVYTPTEKTEVYKNWNYWKDEKEQNKGDY